jgi:C4-type Zn-finger protein
MNTYDEYKEKYPWTVIVLDPDTNAFIHMAGVIFEKPTVEYINALLNEAIDLQILEENSVDEFSYTTIPSSDEDIEKE